LRLPFTRSRTGDVALAEAGVIGDLKTLSLGLAASPLLLVCSRGACAIAKSRALMLAFGVHKVAVPLLDPSSVESSEAGRDVKYKSDTL